MTIALDESSRLSTAFAQAVRWGWMSRAKYEIVVDDLVNHPRSSLLVFGLGYDSRLWATCSQDLAFVEDNCTYLTFAPVGSHVIFFKFENHLGIWSDVPAVPQTLMRPWDYVLVDGPTGFDSSCPGRQISIAWARQLAQRRIFVHDYERDWERYVCDQILGVPSEIVMPSGELHGELAVFDVNPSRPAATTTSSGD